MSTILFNPYAVLADNNCSSTYKAYKPSASPPSYQPYSAENGSYRGQISPRTHRPKNVYVPAYKHRDGSRVRSHYRSKRK